MEFKAITVGNTVILTFKDNQTLEQRSVAFTGAVQASMCIDEFLEHLSEKVEELVVYPFDVEQHAPEVEVDDPLDFSDVDPEDIVPEEPVEGAEEPETPKEYLKRTGAL